MGMPEIPDGKNRPEIEETIIDLLESIALEEMAISHVLNAQGEKMQAVIHKYKCSEIDLNTMNEASRSTNRMVVDLIMKEWLLLLKFNYIDDFTSKQTLTFDKKRKKEIFECDKKNECKIYLEIEKCEDCMKKASKI